MMVLKALFAILAIPASISLFTVLSILTFEPSKFYNCTQESRMISLAPLMYMTLLPFSFTITDILFLDEEKGKFCTTSFTSRCSLIDKPQRSMNFSKAMSVADPDSSGNKFAEELTMMFFMNSD